MEETNIRDPVHGQISINENELRVIDSPQFQRLRNIRQLGFSNLVYPGAHHTRFEHSLGTLFLADKMASRLGIEKEEKEYLRMAALLHDIGHLAFSHDSEEVLKNSFGSHEDIGAEIISSSPMKDILSENFDYKKISKYAFGEGHGQLICSDIGADRLDYLLRDAHYTGVAYGVIDWDRIIATLRWEEGKPALGWGGLEPAESLLLARFSMFHTVYYHHAVRIARKMFQKALSIAVENSGMDKKTLLQEGDLGLISKLSEIKGAKEYALPLSERKLFKRSLVMEWKSISKEKQAYMQNGQFEKDVLEKFDSALVDLPPKFSSPGTINIINREGKMRTLNECSPISSSLEKSAEERATLLVCAPEKNAKEVGAFARKLISD